jgi:hypothetical protein
MAKDQQDDLDDDKINTEGLSDEEISALSDSDEDEADVLDDLTGDEDDQQVVEKADNKADKIDAKKTDADVKAESSETADEVKAADAPEFLPVMRVDAVEGYEEKRAALEAKMADADDKLENGEIELKEYTKVIRATSDELNDLKSAKQMADFQLAQNIDTAKQKWDWEQDQFMNDDANKIYIGNSMLLAALNAKVIEIANMPDAQNGKSGTWILKQADKEVRKLLSNQMTDVDNPKVTHITNNRKPDLKDIPKTLANIPAAENTGTGEDEFGYLDNLDGMDYERAVAAIDKDPAKAERFARAG